MKPQQWIKQILKRLSPRQRAIGTLVCGGAVLALSFQNCSEGFGVLDLESMKPSAALSLVMPPSATKGYIGDTAVLSVVAYTEENTSLTFQWKKEGVVLEGATEADLYLTNLKASDAGTYTVEIKAADLGNGKRSSIENQSVALEVASVPASPMAPVLLNGRGSFVMRSGERTYHHVNVDGYPKPSLQWMKDGIAVAGQNRNFILFDKVAKAHEGVYTLEASNSAGVVYSQPILVAVDQDGAAPRILGTNHTGAVALGSPVSLDVQAIGIPSPTYQWFKDGQALPGATSSRYSVPSGAVSNSGSYRLVATNSFGSTESTLQVTVVDSIRITTALTDRMVALGTNVTFVPVFVGQIDSYKWFKDDVEISAQTQPTLSLPNATVANSGRYKVRATNISGSVETSSLLTVIAPPVITTQIGNVTATEASTTTLSVQATGTALTYKWIKDAVEIAGATMNSLAIPLTSYLDEATYRVEVTNLGGTVSSTGVLTVPIVTDGIVLYARECASCHNPLATTTRLNRTADQIRNAMMTVPAMQNRFLKNGVIRLTNTQINAIEAALRVAPPVITSQTGNLEVFATQPATFSVTATGTGLTYQWFKGANAITGATLSSYTISNASTADAEFFHVNVTNAGGTVSSKPSLLTVRGTATLISDIADRTVFDGDDVLFTVSNVNGNEVRYEWYHETNLLRSGGVTLSNGQNDSGYSYFPIFGIAPSQAGVYKLRLINPAGVTERSARVTVNVAPIQITSEPAPKTTVRCGQALTLSVTATGRNLTYEWAGNGVQSSSSSVTYASTLGGAGCGSGPLRLTIRSGSQTVTRNYEVLRTFIQNQNGVPTYVATESNVVVPLPSLDLALLRHIPHTSVIPNASLVLADDKYCYFMNVYGIEVAPNCDGKKLKGLPSTATNDSYFTDGSGIFVFRPYYSSDMVSRFTKSNINYANLVATRAPYLFDGVNIYHHNGFPDVDENGNIASYGVLELVTGIDYSTLKPINNPWWRDATKVVAGPYVVNLNRNATSTEIYFAWDGTRAFYYSSITLGQAPVQLDYNGGQVRMITAEVGVFGNSVYGMATSAGYRENRLFKLDGADAATFAIAKKSDNSSCARFYVDKDRVYYATTTTPNHWFPIASSQVSSFRCDNVDSDAGSDAAASYRCTQQGCVRTPR